MNVVDFQQLKKLMALTASDVDAEALAAIRAANKLLTRNGLIWDMVFARVVKVIEEVETISDEDQDPELMEAFDVAIKAARGAQRALLESIQLQWRSNSWISPRQRAVVMEAAERADR